MTSNATWFMDAAAQGGGTPAGTAKVITQGLMAQPEEVRPAWMKGRTEAEVCEIVTRSICEAVEASYVVKDYIDSERTKGRIFDDIYGEVQPYLEYVSRPLDESNVVDFVDPRFSEGPPTFQAGNRRWVPNPGVSGPPRFRSAEFEAKKASAPHRNLTAGAESESYELEASLRKPPAYKETDAALRKAKKEAIWDELPPAKAEWQSKNVGGQNRKVTSSEPRKVRDGGEDALWDDVPKVNGDVVTSVHEVPEAHKKHMADSEKEKGNEAFYAKDFEEAEAYYTRSLQYMADDVSTWSNRALVRLKLQKPEAALQDCEHALALNSNYVKALHRKGKALYEMQRYDDAVRTFQQALLLSPGNSQINGDLMVARRKLRDAPQEVQSCRIEELPDDEPVENAKNAASVPLRPGYTRVEIEEDSDSEEEEKPAPKSGGGFVQVAIEEVSGSEDEAPVASNPKAASAMHFQPPARAPVGFDDMD
ncbi:unnamed protein product [Effrenium voratum]|nr:unnamed protein product [Effrenium voratum]